MMQQLQSLALEPAIQHALIIIIQSYAHLQAGVQHAPSVQGRYSPFTLSNHGLQNVQAPVQARVAAEMRQDM